MAETTTWNGRVYRRWPNSKNRSDRRYFQRSVKGGVEYLHRAVWEKANGKIPEGHHIHHRDEDPGNNDISNLDCLHPKDHIAAHWSDERAQRQREWMDEIRPLTRAWHSSPEGIAEHRRIGGLAYEAFIPTPKLCRHCGAEFKPRKIGNADLFCSNKCKSAARRASGVDDETRECLSCGVAFETNKYSTARTCSRSCGNRQRARTIKARL